MAIERLGVTPAAVRRWSPARPAASGRRRSRFSRRPGVEGDRLDRAGERGGLSQELGASEILDRATLSAPGKPLGKEQWAAAVDSVGSTTLANVLAQTRYRGVVAACGLAGGMDLPATVAPFILRGVTLAGIDSVQCPMPERLEAWRRLATELDRDKLAAMTQTIAFDDLFEAGKRILKGETRGRLVVTIG